MPIFNVEYYLEECIESILSQDYADIEVILIDDGSTDGSGDIAGKYAKVDYRVRVVHKKNEGVSVARNTGLKIAQGKYVVFIDADDYISSNFVQRLVEDIIRAKVSIVTTSKAHVLSDAFVEDMETVDSHDAVERMFYGSLEKSDNGVQLFERELLIRNSLLFDPSKKIGEDFDFLVRALMRTDRVAVDYSKMYYYRPNPASTMNQNVNIGLMASASGFSSLGDSLVGVWPSLKPAIDVKNFGDSVSLLMRSYYVRSEWTDDYEKLGYNTRSLKWAVLVNRKARKKVRVAALAYCVLGNRLATMVLRRIKK